MEAYKIRMLKEYRQLKARYDKLHKILIKSKAGTLDFKLDCPVWILENQEHVMSEYLEILELRAEYEEVDLSAPIDVKDAE